MVKCRLRVTHILLILLLVITVPISAYGVSGQIKITQPQSFPIVIDQPGSYVLTSNITVSTINTKCIEIDANDVTLDLNGHTLMGPGKTSGSNDSGIYASEKNNITIKNGTIQNFGKSGIVLSGSNHQIKDVMFCSNGLHGISIISSIIINCTASYNGSHGIYASYSTITNCITDSNDSHGISATSSTVTKCTTSYNSSHGIYASNSTIVDCTTVNNSDRGIYASNSTITNCTANYNDSHGIYASSRCRIEGNNLRYNGGYGLYISSSYNYAIKNVASENSSGNFYSVSDNYMPFSGDNANYGW